MTSHDDEPPLTAREIAALRHAYRAVGSVRVLASEIDIDHAQLHRVLVGPSIGAPGRRRIRAYLQRRINGAGRAEQRATGRVQQSNEPGGS